MRTLADGIIKTQRHEIDEMKARCETSRASVAQAVAHRLRRANGVEAALTDVFVWLLLLVPATAAAASLTGPDSLWTFAAATLGVIPLAEWIRRATEHLARRAGPAIGGLLNVSFGNTAELVLALFVLAAGKPDVVKAQLTGSIIGNSLLGLGLAIVVGSIGRDKQTFKRARAGQLSSLLVLSMIGLLLPALFDYVVRGSASDWTTGTRRALQPERLGGADSRLRGEPDLHAGHPPGCLRLRSSRRRSGERPAGAGAAWPIWQALAVLAAGDDRAPRSKPISSPARSRPRLRGWGCRSSFSASFCWR